MNTKTNFNMTGADEIAQSFIDGFGDAHRHLNTAICLNTAKLAAQLNPDVTPEEYPAFAAEVQIIATSDDVMEAAIVKEWRNYAMWTAQAAVAFVADRKKGVLYSQLRSRAEGRMGAAQYGAELIREHKPKDAAKAEAGKKGGKAKTGAKPKGTKKTDTKSDAAMVSFRRGNDAMLALCNQAVPVAEWYATGKWPDRKAMQASLIGLLGCIKAVAVEVDRKSASHDIDTGTSNTFVELLKTS